jgi:predicted nuclease of predicted toxin-antitoxin system
MDWARKNGFVVFTNDLDFSRLLALTHDKGPSVIQGRAQNVMPGHIGAIVAHILKRYQKEIEQGALLSFDENKARTRILPL